jgi:hypothetical protein
VLLLSECLLLLFISLLTQSGNFRIHARIWERNIRITLREVKWDGVDWTYLAQDRNKWPVLEPSDNGPSGSMKCGEFFDMLSDCQLFKKDLAPPR